MRRLAVFVLVLAALTLTATAQAGQTPVLSVEGQTLRWTGSAAQYLVERKPGPSFTEVTGHIYTPPADTGHTDSFRVRPKASPHKWSNEVTINYGGETQEEREAREAKERKEREEREAKEKAEREQKEREEREKAEGSFLGKVGTSITLKGVPQRQLGYNYSWVGPSCGGASQSSLESVFSKIVANSKARIVRVGMYQGGSFATFDTYVAAAKKYGVRILPMLTGNWGDCESGGEKYLPFWQTGYLATPQSASQPKSFKAYVEEFATHFKNEPTIAWYQLANEPDGRSSGGACSEASAASALRSFADSLTSTIKAIDPNHMVDLGAISWCGGQGSDYGSVNAGQVDLCDAYHDYTKGTEAFPSSLSSHLKECLADGKPSFIGEAGICAYVDSAGNCSLPTTATTLQNRANDFKAKIEAALKAGAVGYMIWSTGFECSGSTEARKWVVGTGNAASGCPVQEIDPTEGVMAGIP